MRKSRFEDVGTFGNIIPDFSAESVDLLDRKAEIALRQRYDFELKCAIELKRREEAEKSSVNANLLKERAKACASAYPLRNFIYESFPIIEKGREFKNNWHIDAISEVLQAATIGEVKNAIVNIPRRTMKSLLVCVMWQSWVWTFLPQTRWVFISYSAEFAKRDNEKTKELLLSKYYQDRWGSTVRLTTERRGKLENTAGGFRVVFRVGQGLGEGGDFMIADDPNAVNEVESEAILEKTNRGWDEVGFHNVTDRATAIRFIMQQRTAPNDLTGHIVDDAELSKLYSHLCLAMKFDPEHPYGNSISKPFKIGTVSVFDKVKDPEISDLEIGEEKLWIDPRSTDAPFFQNKWYQKWYKRNFTDKGLESKGKGQLLWETYLTADLVAQDIAHLKAHGEHSQFQQLPTRRGGNFFNSDLFLENGKAIDPESIDYDNMSYCRFWDKAGTHNAGDWTVGMLVGVTNPTGSHLKAPRKCYIFDIVRVQRGFYSRMDLMVKTAEQDVIDYVDRRVNTSYCVAIEVEPASGGKDVSTIEKDALLGYDVRSRKARGTKAWRAETPRRTSEAGRLKLIRGDWNSGFISRLERFNPALSNNKDDEIDTLSGALKELLFTTTHKSRSSSGY